MTLIGSEAQPAVQQRTFGAGGALVFGGSGGLGSAIALTLARYGADVAVTYRSRLAEAEKVAESVRGMGRRASLYQTDLTERASVEAAVVGAAKALNGLHTVVFATGPLIHLRYLSQTEPERLQDHLNSDIMGFFHVVQAALPHLRESRGSFVACCTCGLERWPIKDVLSVVPKAGVAAISHGVAREEGRFGVRSNVIGTGVINAGASIDGVAAGVVPESFLQGAVESTPLGRLGDAEDIAEAVAFLASQQAKFITGQILNVDGGWSI